jgi:hypothetical protein
MSIVVPTFILPRALDELKLRLGSSLCGEKRSSYEEFVLSSDEFYSSLPHERTQPTGTRNRCIIIRLFVGRAVTDYRG